MKKLTAVFLMFVCFLFADEIKNYNIEIKIGERQTSFKYDFDYKIESCCISFYSYRKDLENLKIEGKVREYKKYDLKKFLGIEIQNRKPGWYHYTISYTLKNKNFYFPLIQWTHPVKNLTIKIDSGIGRKIIIQTPSFFRTFAAGNIKKHFDYLPKNSYMLITLNNSHKTPADKREKIDRYVVSVKISPNGDLDVTELIYYDFGSKKHGIYRYIPQKDNIIKILDVKMDNRDVHSLYKFKNNTFFLKIGDKNRLISGKHLYTIKYKITHTVNSYDNNSNFISFNAIGSGWDVDIYDIKILYTLAANLNNYKIRTFPPVNMKRVAENKILFTYPHLPPYNGIKINLIFDKNVIKENTLGSEIKYFIPLFIIFVVWLFYFYKKYFAKNLTVSPQYYPPKLNVLKTGLILDSWVDGKDITAAVLQLAQKKYLQIQAEDNFLYKKFIFKKLKECKGCEYEMKLLFDFLFKNSDIFTLPSKNVRFDSVMEKIEKHLYSWAEKENYFSKDVEKERFKLIFKLSLIILPFHLYATYQAYVSTGVFGGMFGIFTYVFFLIMAAKLNRYTNSRVSVFVFIFVFVFFLFGLYLTAGYFLIINLTVAALFLLLLLDYKIGFYTLKGLKTKQYILGFKEFVKKVEKDKINTLLKENPHYLDETLPYAVIFGYVKKWEDFYNQFNLTYPGYGGNVSPSHFTSSFSSYGSGSSSSSGSGGGGGGSW
ncbi:DUF2207 domain-containing protein [Nautilia sp.]